MIKKICKYISSPIQDTEWKHTPKQNNFIMIKLHKDKYLLTWPKMAIQNKKEILGIHVKGELSKEYTTTEKKTHWNGQ